MWVETPWEWTPQCQESFDSVKQSIAENACAGTDYALQFHLVTDASKTGVGGVLFQLRGIPAGTMAGPKHRASEQIVMFLSFRLSDQESRYTNPERECLAVVKCLTSVARSRPGTDIGSSSGPIDSRGNSQSQILSHSCHSGTTISSPHLRSQPVLQDDSAPEKGPRTKGS
jgi:hypothetical protein